MERREEEIESSLASRFLDLRTQWRSPVGCFDGLKVEQISSAWLSNARRDKFRGVLLVGN